LKLVDSSQSDEIYSQAKSQEMDMSPVYHPQIDFIKGTAIIAVILLHSLPEGVLKILGAPFHIWQAVPLFFLVAGFNARSSFRYAPRSITAAFSVARLLGHFKRLMIPYLIIFVVETTLMYPLPKYRIIKAFFEGAWGPGAYFIPVFIQFIIVAPLVLELVDRLPHPRAALILFVGSMTVDFASSYMPESLYSITLTRYMFAISIGMFMADQIKPGKGLVVASIIYIWVSTYYYPISKISTSWHFQHAPAYFYTWILALALWHFSTITGRFLTKIFIKIGKASYHIFLFQMLYFQFVMGPPIENEINIIHILGSLLICPLVGYLFYVVMALRLPQKTPLYSCP
jgi:peptidoglycan/LPS O-acetylase OafA/YrhL